MVPQIRLQIKIHHFPILYLRVQFPHQIEDLPRQLIPLFPVRLTLLCVVHVDAAFEAAYCFDSVHLAGFVVDIGREEVGEERCDLVLFAASLALVDIDTQKRNVILKSGKVLQLVRKEHPIVLFGELLALS